MVLGPSRRMTAPFQTHSNPLWTLSLVVQRQTLLGYGSTRLMETRLGKSLNWLTTLKNQECLHKICIDIFLKKKIQGGLAT